MPLFLLFLGGIGGYCGANAIGGIGIAVCGTAFGISTGVVTTIGTIGGASIGLASGIAIENAVNQKRIGCNKNRKI